MKLRKTLLFRNEVVHACLPGWQNDLCRRSGYGWRSVNRALFYLMQDDRAYQSGWHRPDGERSPVPFYSKGPKPKDFDLPEKPVIDSKERKRKWAALNSRSRSRGKYDPVKAKEKWDRRKDEYNKTRREKAKRIRALKKNVIAGIAVICGGIGD